MDCNTTGYCEPGVRRMDVSGKENSAIHVYGTCAGRSSRAQWVFPEQVFWSACWGPELRQSYQLPGRSPAPTSSSERWRSPDSPATSAHTVSTPSHTGTREQACSDKCYYTRFTNTISHHLSAGQHACQVFFVCVCFCFCVSVCAKSKRES